MPDKRMKLLYISRMLSSKKRADLLAWVHLAYTAECSIKKLINTDVTADKVLSQQMQEYSCKN